MIRWYAKCYPQNYWKIKCECGHEAQISKVWSSAVALSIMKCWKCKKPLLTIPDYMIVLDGEVSSKEIMDSLGIQRKS